MMNPSAPRYSLQFIQVAPNGDKKEIHARWMTTVYGKPTTESLAKWVKNYEDGDGAKEFLTPVKVAEAMVTDQWTLTAFGQPPVVADFVAPVVTT